MIAAGRRSKTSADRRAGSCAGSTCSVPNVSTNSPTGRGLADRVGDLHLDPVGQPGGHRVLGHPAHRVRGRPVDLRRVLAGERAAAVPGHAAVGVDDDLAAGQAGVAHRAADDEPAGRVDQQPHVRRCRGPARRAPGSTTCSRMSTASSVSRSMSAACWRGDHHGVQPHGLVADVLDGDLGLAVRPQVGQHAALARPRSAAGTAGGPARSAAASARGCRCTRSRTSGPGRRRPAGRSRRPSLSTRAS